MPSRLTWIGHATVLVELDGTRLLTDPLLLRGVAHLRRRAAPAQQPQDLDGVLVSHLHHDHLHVASVRLLGDAPVVVPRGAGRVRAVKRLRRPVIELAAGESTRLGSVTVRAVDADHDGRRVPVGRDIPAIGYVLEGTSTVYFAGDTDVFDGMARLAPHVDVALLPVWGWGIRLGPGHMDPKEAARAAALVRPTTAVPIHWGTYLPRHQRRRHHHVLRTPGTAFAEATRALAPEVDVRVLAPGEALECPSAR